MYCRNEGFNEEGVDSLWIRFWLLLNFEILSVDQSFIMMTDMKTFLRCILILFVSLISFHFYSQVPAGDRILGMHITAAENEDFNAAFDLSLGACASATHLFTPWSWLETTPGAFDGNSVQYLDIANYYYPLMNMQVELNIAVTNTVTREVPEVLETYEWDDDYMITQFNILLDSVFEHIPDLELVALMIGNESDILWGTDEEEVIHFRNFIQQVKIHAEELYFNLHGEDLDVGTTLTYGGVTAPATAAIYHDLNAVTDVISITYYHTGIGFQVLPSGDLAANWALLESTYADMEKPIYIVECGCPTASLLNGSEEHQAAFITEVFNAWDQQISRIKLVYFFMLHDWSQAQVDELAIYYGLENVDEFTEYLHTLGLRTYPGAGEDKLAMERLRCEADARGFCDAVCISKVEAETILDVNIFPNPTSDFIWIEGLAGAPYSITDVSGRMIITDITRSNKQQIDLGSLSPGFYFLQMNKKQLPLVKN